MPVKFGAVLCGKCARTYYKYGGDTEWHHMMLQLTMDAVKVVPAESDLPRVAGRCSGG